MGVGEREGKEDDGETEGAGVEITQRGERRTDAQARRARPTSKGREVQGHGAGSGEPDTTGALPSDRKMHRAPLFDTGSFDVG